MQLSKKFPKRNQKRTRQKRTIQKEIKKEDDKKEIKKEHDKKEHDKKEHDKKEIKKEHDKKELSKKKSNTRNKLIKGAKNQYVIKTYTPYQSQRSHYKPIHIKYQTHGFNNANIANM
jgi:hypothetical protein